jgi:hypothetical protein
MESTMFGIIWGFISAAVGTMVCWCMYLGDTPCEDCHYGWGGAVVAALAAASYLECPAHDERWWQRIISMGVSAFGGFSPFLLAMIF